MTAFLVSLAVFALLLVVWGWQLTPLEIAVAVWIGVAAVVVCLARHGDRVLARAREDLAGPKNRERIGL
jgi:hypothetical protein